MPVQRARWHVGGLTWKRADSKPPVETLVQGTARRSATQAKFSASMKIVRVQLSVQVSMKDASDCCA
jgi:hypothetical protein